MSRPVVVVDPSSSGIELAPAFRARGIPAVAVALKDGVRIGFGSRLRASDFIDVIPEQEEIESLVRRYDPIAILPGTERSIGLAERLAAAVTPRFSNDPKRSLHRVHKALMQEALKDAGIPCLKTLHTASEVEAEAWIEAIGLADRPLIVKPPVSAGSDKVFHVAPGGDWRKAFERVLTEPSKITGDRSATAVIQEQAIGRPCSITWSSSHTTRERSAAFSSTRSDA